MTSFCKSILPCWCPGDKRWQINSAL